MTATKGKNMTDEALQSLTVLGYTLSFVGVDDKPGRQRSLWEFQNERLTIECSKTLRVFQGSPPIEWGIAFYLQNILIAHAYSDTFAGAVDKLQFSLPVLSELCQHISRGTNT